MCTQLGFQVRDEAGSKGIKVVTLELGG
jgi:hypothetical protein